jgi:hypothetical protein
MVLSVGTDIPDLLRCLVTQIQEVVAHGVRHGAVEALTTAYLCLSHKTNLCEVAPGFSTMDKIADDVDIRWLITEFSDYSKAIATIVNME